MDSITRLRVTSMVCASTLTRQTFTRYAGHDKYHDKRPDRMHTFPQAPTKLNFDLALTRQPPSPPLAPSSVSESSSPPSSPNQSSSAALHPNNMTMDSEHSFAQPRPSSLGGPSRGAGRGRGARGRGRGGAASAMTRKKKEELAVRGRETGASFRRQAS